MAKSKIVTYEVHYYSRCECFASKEEAAKYYWYMHEKVVKFPSELQFYTCTKVETKPHRPKAD